MLVSQSHNSFCPILRRFAALGQGFAIGLEDVGALAFLLPAGTRPEDVEGRLRVFQDVRKARVVLADRCGRVKGVHRSLKICGGRREQGQKAGLADTLWRYLREKPSRRAKQALRFKLRCHPSTLR